MRRWDFTAVAGLLLPPGLVIAFYIYLGSFNRMLGDDYCAVYFGKRLGLLRSVWYWYKSWHGGFAASSADWMISVFGPKAFPVYVFLFLTIWMIFTAMAVREALHVSGYASVPVFTAVTMAAFVVFTTLAASPDISQSLFWWGGVRSYLSPLILFTLYVALYFYFVTLSPSGIYLGLWMFISFGLAFLTGGFSETFTPVFCVLLAGLTGISLYSSRLNFKRASTLFLLAGFAGALFSLFAMVVAPGNSIRQAYFPSSPGFLTILRIAFGGYLAFLWGVFGSPYILSGLLGVGLGAVWLGNRMKREADIQAPPGWWVPALLLAGLILAFGCFPPAAYGTSEPPPARTLITPAFLLTICYLAASFLFGEWTGGRSRQFSVFSFILPLVACSLIIFSSYGAFQELNSMRETHISFARQWDQVDTKIKEAKSSNLQEVFIPSMKNWADVAYPTDNPKYWPNICYSKFYDINITAPSLQP